MKNKRRDFLKLSGMAGLAIAGDGFFGGFAQANEFPKPNFQSSLSLDHSRYAINEQIKQNFEIAKNILKPSQKQLERGLELHMNSLVIDCYGFMPSAAPDAALINSAIDSKASQLELQDMMESQSMTRFVIDKREREELENAWKASGVTCVVQNTGEEGNGISRLLKRLANFTYSTDMMSDFVSKAVKPEDILRAKKENRHALYFTGNGVPLPQDWISVEDELRYISVFFHLGIRMMHLTYNRRNGLLHRQHKFIRWPLSQR
ncbi:MAG TPA: membrane dipeptidase, partial [Daejeonella sp.]|nr:membrane dipeptidase [Daejeonella sp.]